jgi:hypothetical protein
MRQTAKITRLGQEPLVPGLVYARVAPLFGLCIIVTLLRRQTWVGVCEPCTGVVDAGWGDLAGADVSVGRDGVRAWRLVECWGQCGVGVMEIVVCCKTQ